MKKLIKKMAKDYNNYSAKAAIISANICKEEECKIFVERSPMVDSEMSDYALNRAVKLKIKEYLLDIAAKTDSVNLVWQTEKVDDVEYSCVKVVIGKDGDK